MSTRQSCLTILLLTLLKELTFGVPILHEWGPTENIRLGDGGDPGDFFGFSVDVLGNTLAAGATGDADRGTDAGAVYMYTRGNHRKWTFQQKLIPNDGPLQNYVNDGFGTSVSLLTDLVAIGSPLRGVTIGVNPGAVYIFKRNNGVWSQHQIIQGNGAGDRDLFGGAVKFVNETTLVVGAPVQPGLNRPGAIYIFNLDGNGEYQQSSRLEGSTGTNNDLFGFSLDSDGSRVIVGAPGDDDNGVASGSAYIFDVLNSGNLVETTKLVSDIGLAGDEYGYSVAIGPTTAAVGARSDDDNFIGNGAGSVYMYDYDEDNTSWEFSVKITRTNPHARITSRPRTGLFGSALGLDGNYLVIGAPGWDSVAFKNVGRVFVYQKRNKSGKWKSVDIIGSCGEIPTEGKFGGSLAIDMSTRTLVVGAIEGGGFSADQSPGTVFVFERRPFSSNILLQKIRCWIRL